MSCHFPLFPVTWSIIRLQTPLTSCLWIFPFGIKQQITSEKSRTLEEMKRAVEGFAANLGEEAIRWICQSAGKRAEACVAAGGGHFERI